MRNNLIAACTRRSNLDPNQVLLQCEANCQEVGMPHKDVRSGSCLVQWTVQLVALFSGLFS
jgi:hypothetical protein